MWDDEENIQSGKEEEDDQSEDNQKSDKKSAPSGKATPASVAS